MSQHFRVLGNAVVVETVGPRFLRLGEHVHLPAEEVQLLLAVVPPVVGTEHLVVLPHVRPVAEVGGGKVAAVLQTGRLHEGGVHVHIHLVVEHEQMGLGVVGAVQTFDNLSVLVPHGGAVLENGHGVAGVVIQVTGAQDVVVLVLQLDQVAAETGHIFVYHILQGFTGEGGLVLDNTNVPRGVDDVGTHVPQGGIAKEVGVVVEEFGRSHYLTEVLAVLFDELGALGADELHFVLAF